MYPPKSGKEVSELEKTMNVKQVCEYLGISQSTLYVYKKKNNFPFRYKNGTLGRPFFIKEEVDAWVKGEK